MSVLLITGGTGSIGSALTTDLLSKGYEIIILTRNPEKQKGRNKVSYAGWDIEKELVDTEAIKKADYIIHLAGAGVADKRWTDKRKKEIVTSRTKSSALIVKALTEIPNKVRTVVSASAIGWYGAGGSPSAPFVETDPAVQDFLGQTCAQWEASIAPVVDLGKRLVKLRTGIVVSRKDGAMESFRKPLKFGVASILGKGKQIVSWIHLDDLVRMYTMAIENEQMSGAYNAVAPFPVTNKNLVLQLAKCVRGKFYIPVHVPSFVLKALLGEMSIEVLKSAYVGCDKIKKEGYIFLYPSFLAACKTLE